MTRAVRRMVFWLAVMLAPLTATAQDFSGLARLDVAQSRVRDAGEALEVHLFLSQAIPYRVFHSISPPASSSTFARWTGVGRRGPRC